MQWTGRHGIKAREVNWVTVGETAWIGVGKGAFIVNDERG